MEIRCNCERLVTYLVNVDGLTFKIHVDQFIANKAVNDRDNELYDGETREQV